MMSETESATLSEVLATAKETAAAEPHNDYARGARDAYANALTILGNDKPRPWHLRAEAMIEAARDLTDTCRASNWHSESVDLLDDAATDFETSLTTDRELARIGALEAERDIRFKQCCSLNGALRRWADELDAEGDAAPGVHLLTDEGVTEFENLAEMLRYIATLIGTASTMRP